MKRRFLCALMALLLLAAALPVSALAAPKIAFRTGACIVYKGASGRLKPVVKGVSRSKLSWKSSRRAVVRVNKGRVRARKVGLSTITASYGGVKAKLKVVVLPRSATLPVGGTGKLPRAGVETYRSADESIATVSEDGVVTGVALGETQLEVTCGTQTLTIALKVAEYQVVTGQSKAAKTDVAGTANQIVLVEHTGGSKATISLHEKKDGVWTQLSSTAGYVGKNGIGKTVEGDKKTPTGTYNLTTPFGIKDDPGAQMPYTKVTKYHYWCGASSSKYYNQLVDERTVDRKHTSSDEYLINYKGVYNYCLFIDYNAEGVAHKGSCIFLHCTGSNAYTAGCVAVPEAFMKKIVQWAKPGVKIVIGKTIA